jgi:hypothetical protein
LPLRFSYPAFNFLAFLNCILCYTVCQLILSILHFEIQNAECVTGGVGCASDTFGTLGKRQPTR